MDAPRPAVPSSRPAPPAAPPPAVVEVQSGPRLGRRGSSGNASCKLAPLGPLEAARKRSLSLSPVLGGGEVSASGGLGAPTTPSLRRAPPKHWLPKVSSTGALRLEPLRRRRSAGGFEAKPSQAQRSLASACRRYSLGPLPDGAALQAAPLERRPSLQLQDLGGQRLDLGLPSPGPPSPAASRSCSPSSVGGRSCGPLPRPATGAQRGGSPRQAFLGFLKLRRASLVVSALVPRGPGLGQQEQEDVGCGPDEACSEEHSPSKRESSPHASMSGDTRVPEDAEVQVPYAATLLEVYSGCADDGMEVHDRFLRLAFRRFEIGGASEVARERLHDALIHMGFLTSTEARAVDLATQSFEFQNLDYVDFCEYVNNFAALERAAVRQRADVCLAEHGGAASLEGVQRFLQFAGVCLPYSHVEKARKAAGLDHMRPEDMGMDDLLLTLAACKMEEGFTREEVAAAHEIFGELEQEQQASSSAWGPMAKASALVEGLLKFTGLYCVDYMEMFSDIMPSDSTEQGICFHEFLIWARRLRDAMIKDLWKCFEGFEASGCGAVQLDIAVSIVKKFGISLLADAVDELLSDLGMQKDATLDFHALVQFLAAARRTHGFSRTERQELSSAFESFDYEGTGELNHPQVLDLLRHLGNTTSFEEANSMINRVDFNANGSMDIDEFLRLMRLMREQDVECALRVFNGLSNRNGRLPAGSVKDALAKLQLFPQIAMIAELLQDMPAELSFTSFMRLHDQCRFRMNFDFRKRGGFSEDTVLEIAELWNCGGPSRQFATVGELLWMLSDSYMVPVSTSEGRDKLLRRVQAAREAAVDAGVPEEEVSRGGTTDIGFYTFVHMIRGMTRETEQEVHTREKEAVAFAQFSTSEAAEFRRIFCDYAERDSGRATWNQLVARKRQCVDKLLARLTKVPAISELELPILLKSIGVKVPSSKLQELKQFLAENRSRVEAEKNTIQFATFLRLLRWMLDTDFAGICSVMDVPRSKPRGTPVEPGGP
ncbi:unnamed protein product [Prorocentrum cordatum]|uniref:Calmodulin n=1 Tax=Prorocentrum cordatum TaxID=2364126 RepID=A0ABN9Y1F1_9DINO|nr:unnamed protein product [Polarella glacialis]